MSTERDSILNRMSGYELARFAEQGGTLPPRLMLRLQAYLGYNEHPSHRAAPAPVQYTPFASVPTSDVRHPTSDIPQEVA